MTRLRLGYVRGGVLALLLALFFLPAALHAQTMVHDKDRIVFCGDSITGQAATSQDNGWIGLIGKGLAMAHPQGSWTLTGLGASGCTVGGWLNIEKKSRTAPEYLDNKTLDVKATLDGGADIIVIMLGMNDVLSPTVKDDPKSFDAWADSYKGLIDALRARAHPRVIALATITPCTEDLDGPKNRVEAELNKRLRVLAQQEGAIVLPTHETEVEFLEKGRGFKPDFHVTRDFVHPSAGGQLAIPVGMLRGLGETDAAQQLVDKNSKWIFPKPEDLPTLSYTLKRQPGSPDDAKQAFTVHYQWTATGIGYTTPPGPPNVAVTIPDGWTATHPTVTGLSGTFGWQGDIQLSGPLDHLVNTVTLHASAGTATRDTAIPIPAGWRIAVGKGPGLGWFQNTVYDPTKDHIPLDALMGNDAAFLAPVTFPIAAADGAPSPWQLYVASLNYTGNGAPGSVDMAAVTFFTFHDLAYGVRWIHSDKDRPVDVNLSSQAFASASCQALQLNDDQLYWDNLRKDLIALAHLPQPQHAVTLHGKLHAGWNRLVFRTNFLQWQWQFSIDLAGQPGDDLSDLRYATAPPPGTVAAPPANPKPAGN